jgi:hypothetical protein
MEGGRWGGAHREWYDGRGPREKRVCWLGPRRRASARYNEGRGINRISKNKQCHRKNEASTSLSFRPFFFPGVRMAHRAPPSSRSSHMCPLISPPSPDSVSSPCLCEVVLKEVYRSPSRGTNASTYLRRWLRDAHLQPPTYLPRLPPSILSTLRLFRPGPRRGSPVRSAPLRRT